MPATAIVGPFDDEDTGVRRIPSNHREPAHQQSARSHRLPPPPRSQRPEVDDAQPTRHAIRNPGFAHPAGRPTQHVIPAQAPANQQWASDYQEAAPTARPYPAPAGYVEPAHYAQPEPAHYAQPETAHFAQPEPTHYAQPEPAHYAQPETAHYAQPEPARYAQPETAHFAEPEPRRHAQPPRPAQPAAPTPQESAELAQTQPNQDDIVAALSLVRRFAIQADLDAATRILCHGIQEVVGCERVQCLTADPLSGQPWAIAEADDSMAALAARHLTQVAAQPGHTCPVYTTEVDDPVGTGNENLLAQPIMAGGGVIAVLVAVRNPSRPLFGGRENALMMMLAEQCGPLLLHAVHTQAQRRAATPESGGLFRGQALENHRTSRKDGAVLELSPRWIKVVYPSVLLALLGAFAYGFFGKVHQYSTGDAIIKTDGVDVTARAGGTVSKVNAQSGQKVEKGDVIVQLHADSEDADLIEINKSYQQQLIAYLFDPSNSAASDELARTTARKEKAEKMLGDRAIRAPRAGYLGDLNLTPGQRLETGDFVFSVTKKNAAAEVIAFLPAADLPRLKVGMELQLKMPGHVKANERVTISSVGTQVMGARAAQRYLGSKSADTLALKGPFVMVGAKLSGKTFKTRDGEFAYADGQTMKALASVKSRRIWAALIPALEKYL